MENEIQAQQLLAPWDRRLINSAIDGFWDSFLVKRPLLRLHAASQDFNFPEGYIARFINRLNRADWNTKKDSDYSIPLKMMKRLASKPWVEDRDEYICSVFSLEKRVKRIKLCAEETPWDIGLIQSAIDHFWERFFVERPCLRPFADSLLLNFPKGFICCFVNRLHAAKWNIHNDSHCLVPMKIMARLAKDMSNPVEFEHDYRDWINDQERKLESKANKIEDQNRRSQKQLKYTQKYDACKAARVKKQVEKKALKKVSKDTKKKLTEINQRNRIGATSIGL